MFIEKRKISQQELARISITLNIVLIAIFIILLFAFWNIQVLKNFYYTDLATRNIRKQIELKAPRGLILDRHLKRISENKLNFDLFLTREFSRDLENSIKAASVFTGLEIEEIQKRIAKFKGFPGSYAIPIKKDLTIQRVIYIESRSDEYPEFEVKIEPTRAYPHKKMGSHILGYISELTADQLKQESEQGYKLGDVAGKSGVEKIYESFLRGENGVQHVVKDNLGKVREVLDVDEPIIGHSVVLTIDMELQAFIEQKFDDLGEKGTV
ncbi:MAG: hypothetical protein GY765_28645, partial [bacterium]|nr:hypothetical protein [bacterium]